MQDNQYQIYTQAESEAYTSFEQLYRQRNPMPEKPAPEKENHWIFWIVMAVMIAALNVSAAHTVPFFVTSVDSYKLLGLLDIKYIVGLSAFVMVELAIIIMSYSITRRHFLYDREKKANPGKVGFYFRAGLGLVLLIAVAVNMYSTYMSSLPLGGQAEGDTIANLRSAKVAGAGETESPDTIKTLLLLLVGFSAPAMAFLMSDSLGLMAVEDRSRKSTAIKDHQSAIKAWREELNAAWSTQKGKGAFKIRVPEMSAPLSAFLSAGQPDTDGHGQSTGHGYHKRTDARQLVRDHLTQHPEDINRPVRDLATVLGVGKSTVSDVQREFKQ